MPRNSVLLDTNGTSEVAVAGPISSLVTGSLPIGFSFVWADAGPQLRQLPGWMRPGIVYVNDLPAADGKHRLAVPLKVEVERGEEVEYSIFAPELSLGGVGNTFEVALGDLAQTAFSMRDAFLETPREQLGDTAVQALARLRAFLGA